MMLAIRYQHRQQQQPAAAAAAAPGRRPTWAASLRERLGPRRSAAGTCRRPSRLVDATCCPPWNGSIYRGIDRWRDSWTLLDNPVHREHAADFNGETRSLATPNARFSSLG